jgi:hypothetical protein
MRSLLVALAIVCSISAAHAQLFGGPTRYAVSGKPLKIYSASSTNPDCTSAGSVEVRITQPPQNGRIVVSSRQVFPSFPESNVRSACNRRRVPGVELSYVSNRGYAGPDSASVEVIYPTGLLRTVSVSVSVR